MNLYFLLLAAAAIIFAADAWLHRSLMALGLFVFMVALIVATHVIR